MTLRRFQGASFDNFKVTPKNKPMYESCKCYCENIFKNLEEGNNLIISGTVGIGKTHLMHAMIEMIRKTFEDEYKDELNEADAFNTNALIKAGIAVEEDGKYIITNGMKKRFVDRGGQVKERPKKKRLLHSVQRHILRDLRKSYGTIQTLETLLKPYQQADILFIDELGLQYGTLDDRMLLYDIFDYRWQDKRPTVCFTNFTREQLINDVLKGVVSERLFNLKTGARYVRVEDQSRR